jgi:hypothetical protein
MRSTNHQQIKCVNVKETTGTLICLPPNVVGEQNYGFYGDDLGANIGWKYKDEDLSNIGDGLEEVRGAEK